MLMRVLGIAPVDFKSQDGAQIKGFSVYTAFEDERVTGERTEKLFVRQGIELPKMSIGDTVDVLFNMRGKVEAVEAVAK